MKGQPQLDSHQNEICYEESDEELLGLVGFAREASTVRFFKMGWKERRGGEEERKSESALLS